MSERTMLIDADGNRYFFDAVFSAAHDLNIAVTSHPVQTGGAVADHAYIEPETVTLEIGMSDVMTGPATLSMAGAGRAVNAYRMLRQFALLRKPLTLITRLNRYDSMLIETVAAEETADTMHALRAEITLKRLVMAQVAEVSVQQTASSGKICYEPQRTSANAAYCFSSSGGTQAAYPVEEGTHVEAILWQLYGGGV